MLLAAKETVDLPWLAEHQQHFSDAIAADRCPHALLIYGGQGTGRRELARSIVEQRLGGPLDNNEQHPDFREVIPEIDNPDFVPKAGRKPKRSIGVDQARDVIEFLRLTSHQRGFKVVAIFAADRMTIAAANSFLKTLEEPPSNTLIIVVCEKITSLPATIVSRCQHIRVAPPSSELGVEWLRQQKPEIDWQGLLEFCGNAPLFARDLEQSGFIDVARGYARDLNAIQNREADPVAVARKWVKTDINLCLRWLYAQAAKIMRQQADGGNANQSTEACYVYLRELNQLKRLQNGGVNMDLNLARLLFAWYGGFIGIQRTA
jgi:DNA polymerase-3 subunit delta'